MISTLTNAIKGHVNGLDRLASQAKFGTISSVNYETGDVRVIVQPDGVLSGWLPLLSPWVGDGWGMICPPSRGDQVLLVSQEGDVEQSVVVGRAFSRKQPSPKVPDGELWLVHKTGSFLKLCGDGTIRMKGDVHVNGDVWDRHGSLSRLRETYNHHKHADPRGGTTLEPDAQD